MIDEKPEVLLVGPSKPLLATGLEPIFTVHRLIEAEDREALLNRIADRVRALAVTYTNQKIDADFMGRFPKLEFVSSFGVGYDHIDATWAGGHGIIVTNTPDVLNEEVADTTLGLLLCTVREFPQGDRFVRAGKWEQGAYPLSPGSLRDRSVGIVGMGRIGQAIARRLEAFRVPIVYHSRRPQAGVPYKHYPVLVDMAREVDILVIIVPGGTETRNMINAEVLEALGPTGIVINMARGSVVDEPALIAALATKKIFAAGLDVFANEPKVPKELIDMDNVVLFPHLGSASVWTRAAMDKLVLDNLLSWASGKGPLTPVPETPPKK
jgi:lactate dehydrogenase-like 2-hydroxyacid dehydrogenase